MAEEQLATGCSLFKHSLSDRNPTLYEVLGGPFSRALQCSGRGAGTTNHDGLFTLIPLLVLGGGWLVFLRIKLAKFTLISHLREPERKLLRL